MVVFYDLAELLGERVEVDGVLLVVFEEALECPRVPLEMLFPQFDCDVFSFAVVVKSINVECLFECGEAAV